MTPYICLAQLYALDLSYMVVNVFRTKGERYIKNYGMHFHDLLRRVTHRNFNYIKVK